MTTDNMRAFPGVSDATAAPDAQPDAAIIEFCEDLVARARAGQIRAIAVAMVKPGRVTLDGWRRADRGADCCHELMAAITYLQLRYGAQINANDERDSSPSPNGGA
jgi:hypothetical protein